MGKLDRYTIVIDGDNQKLELAAKKTVADLGRVNKAANDSNHKVGKLAAGVRQASTNVAVFQGPLGGVSGRLGALATMLGSVNPLMVGLGIGVSGVTLFMSSAIKEFDQFNLRNKKTEALLKATGNASGFTGEQLDKMAKSVALNTLASVEGIKDTQNVLLTFKGVAKSAFEDAIVLSQDMAAVMGTDSKAAALQLGKALESPTAGISALKKAGVSFSQAERDMIRDMENAGRVVDAQTFILETLKNQIGGAGSSEADGTVIGSIDSFSQHWQQLKVNVADSTGAATAAAGFFDIIGNAAAGWNEILFAEDDARFADLTVKRMELKQELAALQSGDNATFLSWIVGSESEAMNVERELTAVSKEMSEIQERRKKQIIEAGEADAAADQYAADRKAELQAQSAAEDAKKLAAIHAKGALAVSAMEMQFANEDEKIVLNYEKNLARIEAWQVSEKELKARGFESMEALRDEYRDLSKEKFDLDNQELLIKKAEEDEKYKAAEKKKQDDINDIMESGNKARYQGAARLETSLFSLTSSMGIKSKALRYTQLAVEVAIGMKRAIANGYVAGGAAAASLAGTGPQGPALAAAAEAKFISSGYINAAAIGLQGVGSAISISKSGGSSGGSGGSSFDSGGEASFASNDDAVTSINSASERRAGGDVVYNGPYIENVQTMDSQSFDEFAQNNKTAIASATAAEFAEYGVQLGA